MDKAGFLHSVRLLNFSWHFLARNTVFQSRLSSPSPRLGGESARRDRQIGMVAPGEGTESVFPTPLPAPLGHAFSRQILYG